MTSTPDPHHTEETVDRLEEKVLGRRMDPPEVEGDKAAAAEDVDDDTDEPTD